MTSTTRCTDEPDRLAIDTVPSPPGAVTTTSDASYPPANVTSRASGSALPVRQTVSPPASRAPIAPTLNATASTFDDGTPATPRTRTCNVWPGPRGSFAPVVCVETTRVTFSDR